jgi:Delta7-sterol 5-desaturase
MPLEKWIETLSQFNQLELILLFLLENTALMITSIFIGKIIEYQNTQIIGKDKKWILSTLICNTLITYLGYILFKNQIIKINFESTYSAILLDTFLLIFLMDFFMFGFHYLAHKLKWFNPIHQLHHTHIETSVYSLFVLNPVETLGFGIIWISIITAINFNAVSIIIYLILNLSYGILGHLKKDLYPEFWKSSKLTKWISTTQFHANHHKSENHNFGFYFTIWDEVFKTKL